MVENKKPNEPSCGMYNDEECPKDCDDCWPTCAMCGATFPFWNGESHQEFNGHVVIEGGFQCSDRELDGDEVLLCKDCFNKLIGIPLHIARQKKKEKSCWNCGNGQEMHNTVYCTTHEGEKCLVHKDINDPKEKGVWVYGAWIPKSKAVLSEVKNDG